MSDRLSAAHHEANHTPAFSHFGIALALHHQSPGKHIGGVRMFRTARTRCIKAAGCLAGPVPVSRFSGAPIDAVSGQQPQRFGNGARCA